MDSARQNKTAIVAITRAGAVKGHLLHKALPESDLYLPEKLLEEEREAIFFSCPVAELLRRLFTENRRIVLLIATGAAVRLMAPLLKGKEKDPAVVAVDQEGKFAVSLLSGHRGGANALAREVAAILGGVPVITTASDLSGVLSADLLGQEYGWRIESRSNLTAVSAALVNGEKAGVYQDAGEKDWLKQEQRRFNLVFYDNLEDLQQSDCKAALIITDRLLGKKNSQPAASVIYRPLSLVVGIGCRRGTGREEIEEAIAGTLKKNRLSLNSVRNLATIDIKKNEEGINQAASRYGWAVEYFSAAELRRRFKGASKSALKSSEHTLRSVGTPGVCEPAALISSGSSELSVPKTSPPPKRGPAGDRRAGNVTVAVARKQYASREKTEGKLYLVSIGPGNIEQMTFSARKALEDSEIVLGYSSYIDQIKDLLAGKEIVSSGMGGEVQRAQQAISLVGEGRRVALVSGGDAGIYGMAGLVFELLQKEGTEQSKGFSCEVVPGVPALSAAASLLGAPLMCDFAAINLSDLLVAWECIAGRLERAAQGDFVIVLYNPASKKRKEQLARARAILLNYRDGTVPVGIVTDAYRSGQKVCLTDLEHMLDYEIGMNTTIIVGNSTTFQWGERMVTPRGYGSKYDLGKIDV